MAGETAVFPSSGTRHHPLRENMPRSTRNKAKYNQLQQQLQQTNQELEQLRTQQQSRNGFYAPPLPRADTRQWDWSCSACGRLVYTPQNRCNCGLPHNTRVYGATVAGSVRGRRQENSAARQATGAQQRVPNIIPPRPPPTTRVQRGNVGPTVALPVRAGGHAAPPRTHAGAAGAPREGVGGHAAPQATLGSARPRSYAAAVTVSSTNSPNGDGGVQSSSNSAGLQTSQTVHDVAMSAAQRFEEDEVDEPADEVYTLPEEVDDQRSSKELNLHMLKIEKALERRQRALDKAELAVADQKQVIADQQAKLVELEGLEETKREEIAALKEEKRMLSQRLVRVNQAEEQNHHGGATTAGVQQDPMQMATEYLNQSLLGLQNFSQQPPQIKELLLQFARGVEQLQAAERATLPAGQATLEQSFAAQRAQATSTSVGLHDAEFPLLSAAVQKRRAQDLSPTAQVVSAVAPVAPHPAVVAVPEPERPIAPLAMAKPDTEHYSISSGAATPVANVQPEQQSSTGCGYGRAPRKHEPLCKKCWAVVCKCGVPAAHPTAPGSANEGTDEVMDAPETALVVWQPPKTRAQLLQQLEAKNEQQAARARGTDEASSSRPSPY